MAIVVVVPRLFMRHVFNKRMVVAGMPGCARERLRAQQKPEHHKKHRGHDHERGEPSAGYAKKRHNHDPKPEHYNDSFFRHCTILPPLNDYYKLAPLLVGTIVKMCEHLPRRAHLMLFIELSELAKNSYPTFRMEAFTQSFKCLHYPVRRLVKHARALACGSFVKQRLSPLL